MLVSSLKLYNYRNFNRKDLNFYDGLNIIVGKNGVGKTNILESLIVLSNTKSFRTLDDKNLIKNNEEYLKIEAISDKNKFKVVINQSGKKLYINDIAIPKTSKFIGKLNCILFKPNDLNIFSNSPKERRRILDIEIGKVSNTYLDALLSYNLLLKDKNNLLKENNIDNDYLEILEDQMIEKMKIIIKEREEFFEIINTNINNYYQILSNTRNNIYIEYKKCSDINNLKENLLKNKEKDYLYHYASFGTHHDDFNFYMNNIRLENIASQGQTRMALIAFKLSLLIYIKEKINDVPILLLDDILSELDNDNKERLLNLIPTNTQVIVTGTDLNGIKIDQNYKLIEIKEGTNA